MAFMGDLRPRLANRVQLTGDGHKAYLQAVEGAFGGDIDYAMLVKMYGAAPEGEKRYSPVYIDAEFGDAWSCLGGELYRHARPGYLGGRRNHYRDQAGAGSKTSKRENGIAKRLNALTKTTEARSQRTGFNVLLYNKAVERITTHGTNRSYRAEAIR